MVVSVKKKITVIIVSIVIILVCIIGIIFILNKDNSTLNNNNFIKIMEELDLKIYDAKEQFGEDIITSATVAYNSNYQVEFLVFDNVDNCKKAFQINKSSFITNKTENDVEISKSNDLYSIYSLTTEDRYMYIKRVDNKLLYFNVDGSYKSNLDKIIKKLAF